MDELCAAYRAGRSLIYIAMYFSTSLNTVYVLIQSANLPALHDYNCSIPRLTKMFPEGRISSEFCNIFEINEKKVVIPDTPALIASMPDAKETEVLRSLAKRYGVEETAILAHRSVNMVEFVVTGNLPHGSKKTKGKSSSSLVGTDWDF